MPTELWTVEEILAAIQEKTARLATIASRYEVLVEKVRDFERGLLTLKELVNATKEPS